MSLKKKIFNFLTAMVTIFGSAPALATNAYAAIDPSMKPNYGKYVEDNGDGTYNITLHITGKAKTDTQVTKANVVVVFDVSNSMKYCTGTNIAPRNGSCSTSEGQSRLTAAKNATKNMAQTLLSLNTSSHPDVVEMKFISFNTAASRPSDTITDYSAAESWINNLSTPNSSTDTNGGTNWEAALKAASSVTFANDQAGEKTYVVFISDGDPTFRDSQGTYQSYYGGVCQASNGDWYQEEKNNRDKYGTGNSDPCGQNLYYAQQQASAITTAGKVLYSIGIYGDSERMSEVGGTFIDAKTTDALSQALSNIASKITNNLSLTEITINDAITSLADIAVSGNVAHFTYRKGKNWDGNEATLKNLATWNPTADGAGTASFADKKVTWNLGDNYVLPDGETATVTFTVYPDQEAYDLIAELQNGKITYDDLTATQKQSIVKNADGTYSFRTNTASTEADPNPTFHYCVLTTSSTGTQTKECTTDQLTQVNTQPISATTVNVRKIWDAGLDQKQFTDIENTEITFDLLINGSDANKAKLEKTDLKLNKTDNWQVQNIAIAPGSMVSSGHEAYDADHAISYNGTSYTILTTGHQYYFNEHDIDKHFTLVDYEYHPMYVNGELKNVVFAYDANGQITGIQKIKSLSSQNNQLELTATNRLKGGVEITKQIKVNGQVTTAKNTDTFPITIYIKHADGRTDYSSELEENGTCHLSCISIYQLTNPNADPTVSTNWTRLSKEPFQNGKIETTIRSDQKIIISDLEAGAYYSVEETTTNLPVGYDRSESGKITYDIIRYTTYEDGETPTFAAKQLDGRTYYTVENNASSKAIVKNYFYTSSLNVAKTVNVTSGNATQAQSKDFNFNVDIYSDNTKTNKLSTTAFKLKHGENHTVSDLPVGAYYEVTEAEANSNGFTTTAANNTGAITKNQANAAFTNTYTVQAQNTTATARKVFGNYWDLTHINGFDFTLTEKSSSTGAYPTATAIRTTATSVLPASWQFNITDEGTWTYEIAEAAYDHPGVFPLTDHEVLTLTITATDNGDGTLSIVKSYSKNSATIAEADAQIENTYRTQGTTSATIRVAKTITDEVTGNHHADFTFVLAGDTNDEITFNSARQSGAFKTLTFDTAGTYHYTVTEQNTHQPGWSYDTTVHKVTITVTEDYTTATLSSLVTIDDVATDTATFTNTYTVQPTTATIKATKDFGDFWYDGDSFTFTLQGTDNSTNRTQSVDELHRTTSFTLSYDHPGTYHYLITENTQFSRSGISPVTTEPIAITVTVTDNNNGTLTALVSQEATIVNTYTVQPTAPVSITLEKTITALSAKHEDSTFHFAITDSEGTELDTVAITTTNLTGTTDILGLTFDAAGTYEFSVQELDDHQKYFDYDTTAHTITITVADNHQGQLVATTLIDGQESDTLTITNFYNNEEGQGGIPKTPNTGRATSPANLATDTSFLAALALSTITSTLLLAALSFAHHRQTTTR
ncbi:VWA domain-containing protein [Candidatus Saccharibacteria bacterium]|nr:VWA domain-containing protein [Candidatus Saccharibacteria bacterium]